MSTVNIRRFEPSDAAWVIAQHGQHYAQEEGFDDSFGDLVTQILKDFVDGHNPARERGWIATVDGQRVGCIFCVSIGAYTAKLRLFLLTPQARGQGLGHRLLSTCMDFAREVGYSEMVLWTHESHRAACALYAANGWEMVDSTSVHSFGVDLIEQTWRIDL